MSILGVARRTAIRVAYVKRIGLRWARALADAGVWPPAGVALDSGGGLKIPGLRLTIPQPDRIGLEVYRSLQQIGDLEQRANATVDVQHDSVRIAVGGIVAAAYNSADIGVFHEVFVERLYAFEEPGPLLILDIGMNIGLATLFFLRNYNAEVRAFELVPSTAKIGLDNLALNPDLQARATVREYGLSDRDTELDLSVDPAERPENSLLKPAAHPGPATERVQVRDAAKELRSAVESLGARRLVVKLDAEGAEYEIMRRLADTDLLARIDLLMIEWHRRPDADPEELRKLLRAAGFNWSEREHYCSPVGFIYAYRLANPGAS
ncbi:MAG TPA: FkbM family methyltransferase [Fimbriimonadaceae bacterium]|nr:FkbM family methyltransferase [Fimbriimonadaceae bacterium]